MPGGGAEGPAAPPLCSRETAPSVSLGMGPQNHSALPECSSQTDVTVKYVVETLVLGMEIIVTYTLCDLGRVFSHGRMSMLPPVTKNSWQFVNSGSISNWLRLI